MVADFTASCPIVKHLTLCYDTISLKGGLLMNTVKRNKILVILYSTLRTVFLLCITGPIMQTFLASLGFPEEWIYINNGLVQGANILTISLCAQWTDRRSIIKCSVISQLPHVILYLLYIPLCCRPCRTSGSTTCRPRRSC